MREKLYIPSVSEPDRVNTLDATTAARCINLPHLAPHFTALPQRNHADIQMSHHLSFINAADSQSERYVDCYQVSTISLPNPQGMTLLHPGKSSLLTYSTPSPKRRTTTHRRPQRYHTSHQCKYSCLTARWKFTGFMNLEGLDMVARYIKPKTVSTLSPASCPTGTVPPKVSWLEFRKLQTTSFATVTIDWSSVTPSQSIPCQCSPSVSEHCQCH